MLSRSGQTSRILAIETQLKSVLQDYKDALNHDLLDKIQEMSLDGFESLIMTYLERCGYQALESLNRRDDGRLALLAQHDGLGTTLIVAHRSGKTLSGYQIMQVARSLKNMFIDRCLLIHFGGFEEVELDQSGIELIDAQSLLSRFIDHGIGVGQYPISQSYIDQSWFESYGR